MIVLQILYIGRTKLQIQIQKVLFLVGYIEKQ